MILVVGLSPALQRTLEFGEFRIGKVNRAKRASETASGKGVNVARVAKEIGADVRLLPVAGGHRGKLLVDSIATQRIASCIVRVRSETRFCQTSLGGGAITEVVEETKALRAREVAQVVAAYGAELRKARLVVLTGTVPPGCGDDLYARLITKARAADVPALVDAQARQLVNAVRARPFLVRINRDELTAVPRLDRSGVEWFVISNGARQVSVKRGRETFRLKPPPVKTLNSVGSGDAMMAGIAFGLWRGQSMREAVRLGIACGAANALTLTSGVVRRADVQRLLRLV
jgi:tagatose 6-phosphate kinase